MLKKICIFCGSNYGRLSDYKKVATKLVNLFIKHDIELVYGGASVGLMGVIADEMLKKGGKVIGIIPKSLIGKEIAHNNLTKLYKVNSMNERKELMVELSDGFITLPGGFGTLDELFEIITGLQLGLHEKPCGLLNIKGYYDKLLVFLDNVVKEGFVDPAHRLMLFSEKNPEKLLKSMENFKPPVVNKWKSK